MTRTVVLPLLLLATAGSALAASNAGIEEVIVIGTRGAERTVTDSPVPVDVLPGDLLRDTGAVAGELGEALEAVVPSFNFPRQSNSGTSDLIRAGQLRGLSPDQMLVLVNGTRRHTSAIVNTETKIGRGTAAVDFNTIPLGAVKRIEVLRDGAGAQYGSDAIAGVVNVVLDDTPGLSLTTDYGRHETREGAINQEFSDGETFTLSGEYGQALDAGFFKLGARYQDREGTNRAGFDTVPFFIAPTPDNLAQAGQRNYKEGDPAVEQVSLWFNGAHDLGTGEVYGFGTWSDRDSDEGAAFFRYPDSSANVKQIHPDGFRPETAADDQDLGLTLGYRRPLGDWEADAALTFGRNEFEFGVENSVNASLGPDSPTDFDSGTFERSQWVLNLDVTRAFEGYMPASVAVGLEYRREDFESDRGDPASFAAGSFDGEPGAQAAPGLTPADEADVDRDVFSAYFDGGLEVSDALFIDLAGRVEDYSDFGSAATGKFSARYEVNENLALRAAVSNSFRAPNLSQVGFADTTLNFGDNRELIRTRTLPVSNPIARSLGAEQLKEETSTNYSAGFATSLAGISLTVDAFHIKIDDRITLSERLFGDALADFVQAQPGGENVESVRFFTNAVETETVGIDAVANWRGALAGGELDLTAAWNHSETDVESVQATTRELTALDPSLQLVGVEEINTLEGAAPNSKLVLTGRYSRPLGALQVRLSRYGSARRVFNFGGGFQPSQVYGEEWQLDLEAQVDVTDTLEVSLGAQNLLDEYPDTSSSSINFFGNLPYDILSPVGVNGRYVYARVSWRPR